MTGFAPIKSRRLQSWKEIAAYLGRDVRTVIRWEKERQLPIRRSSSASGRPTVFAETAELDRWLLGHQDDVVSSQLVSSHADQPPPASQKRFSISFIAWVLALLLFGALGLLGVRDTLSDEHRHLEFARIDFPASNPMSVGVADFDRDGNPDVVFTNAAADTIDIVYGDGHGGFGRRTSIPASKEPERLAVADLNGDGFIDIAVTFHKSHDIGVLLADGRGGFHESFRHPAGGRSRWITIADVNHDGIPDMVVACSDAHKLSIGLGRGDGTFDRFQEYETEGEASAVLVADITRDGIPDLLTADYRIASGKTVSIYPGTADGRFRDRQPFVTGHGPLALAIGDFNRDGYLDVATADFYDTVSVLLGNEHGFAKPEVIEQGNANGFVGTQDFDGDGILDLVVVGEHSNNVYILYGDGQGNFRSSQTWSTAAYPDSLAIADFDHDGRPDFVVGSVFGNQVSIFLNRTKR